MNSSIIEYKNFENECFKKAIINILSINFIFSILLYFMFF